MCDECRKVAREAGLDLDDLAKEFGRVGLAVERTIEIEFDGKRLSVAVDGKPLDEQPTPGAGDEPADEASSTAGDEVAEPSPADVVDRKATMRAELRAILAAQHTDLPEPSAEGIEAARELHERLGISYVEAVRAVHAAEVGMKLRELIMRSVISDASDAIGSALRDGIAEISRRLAARRAARS